MTVLNKRKRLQQFPLHCSLDFTPSPPFTEQIYNFFGSGLLGCGMVQVGEKLPLLSLRVPILMLFLTVLISLCSQFCQLLSSYFKQAKNL